MSNPRNHHFVPEFHLKHFTTRGTLYPFVVDDKGNVRFWKSPKSPGGVAYREFLYSTEENSVGNKQIVERLLGSRFETNWGGTVGNVVAAKALPADLKERNNLIQFLALSATRTPRFKSELPKALKAIGASPRMLKNAKSLLESPPVGDPLGDQQVSWFENACIHGFYQEDWVRALIVSSPLWILPCLMREKWTLHLAPEGAKLVCSDDPVTVFGRKSEIVSAACVGDPAMRIMMPLSAEILLVSEPLCGSEQMSIEEVATCNSMTLSHSTTGFSIEPEFCSMTSSGVVWNRK